MDLLDLSSLEVYRLLTRIIVPRPIALVSTVDGEGRANLSPFSFFNLFSSDPPVVIFSPLLRSRDGSKKDTLLNLREVPEAVIHIVTKEIAAAASVASGEYPRGVDEFGKAGFTKEKALLVKPPMVREAKAKLECRVTEIKPLGRSGGAGNLVICEVLHIHFNPDGYAPVGRMGGDDYVDCREDALFRLPRPGSSG